MLTFPLIHSRKIKITFIFFSFFPLGYAYVDISGLTLLTEYFDDEESYAWMTIPAGLLKKGSKYKFQLIVNDGSKDGMASMVVEMRSGPTSGSLTVDKTTVQALFDEVVMSGLYKIKTNKQITKWYGLFLVTLNFRGVSR